MSENLFCLETPCFVFDEAELADNFRGFRDAVRSAWSSESEVAYSIKTNPLPWVLEVARDGGCMAEAVSDEEYELALSCGFEPERIVYNGPIKGRQRFAMALEQGSLVNLDSARELRWLAEIASESDRPLAVGLRANIDLESHCPGQTVTGAVGGRFGFCYENGELARAVHAVRALGSNVRIAGLHMHVTTRSRTVEVYRVLAKHAAIIALEFDLDLDFVDIGGGYFGGGDANRGAYEAYAQAIAEELAAAFDPKRTRLVVEPGGAVVCTPGRYLGRVIDAKDTTYGRFVTTDLSRINIDHEMKKTSYVYEIVPGSAEAQRKRLPRQIMCGYTCMESDRLSVLEDEVELMEGDMVVLKNAGAYSMSFTPGFFIRYAPRAYALKPDGSFADVGASTWRPKAGEGVPRNEGLQQQNACETEAAR